MFYCFLVGMFFALCQWDGHPLDSLMSKALLNFQFHMIPFLWHSRFFHYFELDLPSLRKNIHADFRDRIVRRTYNPVTYFHKQRHVSWKDLYIVGRGENKVLCWRNRKINTWCLSPCLTLFKF
ncbi:hypothetical protein P691DRAFT_805742 [Macrolepiota fuliginosa MF-IS2]|uniref:Uncharacterized protein n=1 Tax=Macrolepiota fuliginosa MF-IS2 TaxID=1400762 RepID=A0A9P5WWU3_9AGAR|nr:hypothetical protein P691DRAFT_805742 [Macrolepiota fuliginosa MF-IS2]